jgi:hypothetical protein
MHHTNADNNSSEHTDDETQYGVGDDAVSDELQPLEHDQLHELELDENFDHHDGNDSVASSFDTVDANGQSVHSLEVVEDTDVQAVEAGDAPGLQLQDVEESSSTAVTASTTGSSGDTTTVTADAAATAGATDDEPAPTSL